MVDKILVKNLNNLNFGMFLRKLF